MGSRTSVTVSHVQIRSSAVEEGSRLLQFEFKKNLKQRGIVAIDNCFALLGARQYGATNRESSDEKYPRTLILSPDLETEQCKVIDW